jgi:hypothetical protein
MEIKKVVGELKSKNEGNGSTDVTVGTQKIRAWHTVNQGGAKVPNPAITELAGCPVGRKVEAVFAVVEKEGKTYYNLQSISLQGDSVPDSAPTSVAAPAGGAGYGKSYGKTPYGKSPEERLSITAQAAAHDATPIILEWVKAEIAAQPNWFMDNWENVAKAHTNLMAALADGILDYCASHKEQ